MRLMLAALCLLAARTASAAYCHGAPDPSAKPNLHPIQGKPPVHVRAVSNGLLETAGEGDDLISIVHLWGTAYERGVAHGSLMKADVGEFIPAALAFFAEQAALAINGTAKWIPPSTIRMCGIEATASPSVLAHPHAMLGARWWLVGACGMNDNENRCWFAK